MTDNVKSYRLVRDVNLYRIEWEGGGQRPKALSGRYTSAKEAEKAIAEYEASKQNYRKATREVKVNGTDKGSAGA